MKNGTSSEIDYVITHNRKIIPIEVKAGKVGTLKSLQVFVSKKGVETAIRFNTDLPSTMKTITAIPQLEKKEYNLISLPLYMIGQLPEILKNC